MYTHILKKKQAERVHAYIKEKAHWNNLDVCCEIHHVLHGVTYRIKLLLQGQKQSIHVIQAIQEQRNGDIWESRLIDERVILEALFHIAVLEPLFGVNRSFQNHQ